MKKQTNWQGEMHAFPFALPGSGDPEQTYGVLLRNMPARVDRHEAEPTADEHGLTDRPRRAVRAG